VSLHEDIPREVNKIFASQPLDPGGDGLDPLRPLGYSGLPMGNPGTPPLPLNRPYRWPLNYPKYVKDFDPDAHVKVFKVGIRANSETNDAKIVNLFSFTFKDIVHNNYMGHYPDYTFVGLQMAFCKRYKKVQNDEQVYLQLKNMKQEKNEKVEVYYERLLKLANSLKYKTIDNSLIIIFRS